MKQTPSTGDFLLKWRGDRLAVTLALGAPRAGRAAFRTNVARASVRRGEIIAQTERGETPLERAWTDVPLAETAPGVFSAEIPLDEVGVFSGKACFFPEGASAPEWPEGPNLQIKVESAETRRNNSIYCVFPRQFGSFREIVRRLGHIMDDMGFKIVQTLPPFPVPVTYGVMGEFGSPFAATDFTSVDPALAEFDTSVTPLGQFKELIGAVHAKGGLLFVDLPANHTGWASTLQTHHPEWFVREPDGRFRSPGAWGVTWADLVALDYAHAGLRAYMADVFLFWCRVGVDGFRCDAGYMIPAETWTYIVAKVREEYPDTVFLLEGLGGRIETTDRLLAESNLDWAYSELFQTYDRSQFEGYLPQAIARSERYGALVHFAETHDNDRLAKRGAVYAQLRVELAALLSWQGAWGFANGVEWYATEKIDVHRRNDLNWGARENMVALVRRLNTILDVVPSFSGETHLALVTCGGGNTLAVLRSRAGFPSVLVLANLDCENPVDIDWDRARFACPDAVDLLTDRTVEADAPVRLAPGEVVCLQEPVSGGLAALEHQMHGLAEGIEEALASARGHARDVRFHVVLPRDAARDVVVPEGQWVEASADVPFRLRLIEPGTDRTVVVYRSFRNHVVFAAPSYAGDGTRARRLYLDVTRYVDGRAYRTRSAFLVPPPPECARVKLALDHGEILAHPETRTVLSNGAGAAAQLRVGWGEIRSQYDALLAANPDLRVPSDRLNVWARTRCWLQHEGYLRQLDAQCETVFRADPLGRGARWIFRVPCGMGRETLFAFTYALAEGSNAGRLRVTREEADGNDAGGRVRLVFRPDVEWRSFHATTKAYAGLETRFPPAAAPLGEGREGFAFRPFEGSFTLEASGGVYHHEPEWTYSVAHPEEAARGQEGAGDLFSPGWFSADLAVGETVDLTGVWLGADETPRARHYAIEQFTAMETISIGEALRAALRLYVVRRDDLKTVIAGYPWFLDWGRDTFIFLRGMVAGGMITDAVRILQAFAAFEERGTLPNIIHGQTAGNRDTTDAPLWFVRCVSELAERAGESRVAALGALKKTCADIVENYLAGTPNGIRTDPDSALVWSPSHFTWMDTNYPACTPRVGYPVEIQALWISALKFVGREDLAARAVASVKRLFRWEHGYRDCLAAPNGEKAAEAVPEDTIRPNQLFLITLGVLDDPAILEATEELLVPGGIRSLNAGHPLYRGRYEGDEDTRRKPAYHNGTVWAWPFPLYAEAAAKIGWLEPRVARALLASAVENLNEGCLCQMSEIADGDAPHAQKGCTAQAWSVSETLRVWRLLGGD